MRLCRECVRAKNKASYQRHADKRRSAAREAAAKNREAKSEYNRQYREKHRNRLVEQNRAWRAAGSKAVRSIASRERAKAKQRLRYATDPAYRERMKAAAALYKKDNPFKFRSMYKRWRAANQTPEGRERQRQTRARHRAARQAKRAEYYARRYGESGTVTNGQLYWLHKWQDHRCCYCNAPLEGRETIEHVVPLSRGGENNPHNVLLACAGCNSSKQDRLFDGSEWQPSSVAAAPTTYSAYVSRTVVGLLTANGIDASHRQDGAIALPSGRALHVLSTFWMSDRSMPPTTVAAMKAAIPGDVFTFDYEWLGRPSAMLNVVAAKIGTAESIGARELEVASPSVDEAHAFMGQWHAQGFAGGSWYVGLRHPTTRLWHGMASFRRDGEGYELARLAFTGHVRGGLSRIVRAFLSAAPEPNCLRTYADPRFGDGGGYLHAGFEPDGESVPWYGYANGIGLHSRQRYRKDVMAVELDWFDPSWTEHRLARANGLWRVAGLPQRRYVLRQ